LEFVEAGKPGPVPRQEGAPAGALDDVHPPRIVTFAPLPEEDVLPLPAPLVGKVSFVVHQKSYSVAHGPCTTESTPQKCELCGARAHAPQKVTFLWRTR
jgi:hypothetical protein